MGLRHYLYATLAAVLRIAVGATVAVGLIRELDPFPLRSVAYWQARIKPSWIDFPGSDIFFWFADHWLETSVAIGLIQLSRLTRMLNRPAVTTERPTFRD